LDKTDIWKGYKGRRLMTVSFQINLTVTVDNNHPINAPINVNVSIGEPRFLIQYQCHCGNYYHSEDSPSYGCPVCESKKRQLERRNRDLLVMARTRECSRCRTSYFDRNEVMTVIPVCHSCIHRERVYQEDVRRAEKAREDASNINWKEEGF